VFLGTSESHSCLENLVLDLCFHRTIPEGPIVGIFAFSSFLSLYGNIGQRAPLLDYVVARMGISENNADPCRPEGVDTLQTAIVLCLRDQ